MFQYILAISRDFSEYFVKENPVYIDSGAKYAEIIIQVNDIEQG